MYRNKLENQFWWFRRKLCNFLALLSITLLRTFLYFSLDFVPNLDVQCQKQIFLGNRKHMSMSRFFSLGQLISLLPLHNLNIFTNHPYVSRDMSSSRYCKVGMYILFHPGISTILVVILYVTASSYLDLTVCSETSRLVLLPKGLVWSTNIYLGTLLLCIVGL